MRELLRSRTGRLVLCALALLANVGFYLPSVPSTGGVGGIDTLYHVGVFALTVWAVGRVLAPASRFPIGWVVLAAVVHALLIEVLQGLLLPHRSADPLDVLSDLLGIGIGLLTWWGERRISASGPASGTDPVRPPADASCTRPGDPR
ncbi:VanZ family protein [Brachybacterium endophyticum]|uniref:VanZ family protein n=1 Tax=Brachybacterium endophyticum TaxID=2182385 RepID=A0A2U2RHC6_9MICO|nr:VanZ family protein [Brachybacterium endophyticum]PWH05254.1 VanZ family protein [Brachybacterium endophyticum]